jgi:uncharacterized membrane protein YeaQ/YmgE (transglycosylase-associated protein family)
MPALHYIQTTIANRATGAARRQTILTGSIAMHMSGEGLLVMLVVGLAAGWLAGEFIDGTGFGLLGDVIIGIIGAFIGDWLMPRLGLYLGAGLIASIANATIGAILLLLIVRLVRGGGRWSSGWANGWRRRWR